MSPLGRTLIIGCLSACIGASIGFAAAFPKFSAAFSDRIENLSLEGAPPITLLGKVEQVDAVTRTFELNARGRIFRVHVPEGSPIGERKLEAAPGASTPTRREAAFTDLRVGGYAFVAITRKTGRLIAMGMFFSQTL